MFISSRRPLSLSLSSFLFFFFVSSALARGRHVITFRAPDLYPSTLRWDPAAQHFLVGSRRRPVVTSVSDAGILETIIHDRELAPESSLPSVAVDPVRRRLLAVVACSANPTSSSSAGTHLVAYDLRSPRPYRRIFLSLLPSSGPVDPADVAVNPATGDAYVTSSSSNLVWKVDPQGVASVFSRSAIYGGDDAGGLAGIAHVGKGYLLVVQSSTGKVFKVDADDGKARTVLMVGKKGIAAGSDGVAVRGDGSAAFVGGHVAWIVTSDDSWGEAAVHDEIALGGGGEEEGRARGVAVREGRRVYVLFGGKEEGSLGKDDYYRIEEVEWEREKEGEWVVGLVLLGAGLAYFLYWRFQMGQLVGNMNKKRI